MKTRSAVGFACLAGFIGCVFLANLFIQHVGTLAFPGGPHTLTLGPWTAPSGWVWVGLSFCLRDVAQLTLGKRWVIVAIVIGAALSYVIAPNLAAASAAGFFISEMADFSVFTPLSRRNFALAVALSNTVGAAVDTIVFLWLAFNWAAVETFGWDQFVLKLIVTIPFLAVYFPVRHAVLARHA